MSAFTSGDSPTEYTYTTRRDDGSEVECTIIGQDDEVALSILIALAALMDE